MIKHKSRGKADIWSGLTAAWPIALGYIPLGLACGVVAQQAGLHPMEIGLMSLVVFAGSAQFIAVSMLGSGAGVLAIIATTFVVNLRHLLMSSSLALYLGNVRKRLLPLFAYGITDESFGVNIARFREVGWNVRRALVVNQVPNAVWILTTVIGGYGGRFIPEGAFGINYALPAMFIGLLALQLKGRKYVLTAVVAAGLAVALSLTMPGSLYIFLAAVGAATICVPLFRKFRWV